MRDAIKRMEDRIKSIRVTQQTLWNKLADTRDGITSKGSKKMSNKEYFSSTHTNTIDKTSVALKTCYKNIDDALEETEHLVESLHSEDKLPFDITVTDPILDSIEYLVDSFDPNTRQKDIVRRIAHDEFISKYTQCREKYWMEETQRKADEEKRKTAYALAKLEKEQRMKEEKRKQEEETKLKQEEEERTQQEHIQKQIEALKALVLRGGASCQSLCHRGSDTTYYTYSWTDPNQMENISQYHAVNVIHEWNTRSDFPRSLVYIGRKIPNRQHNDNCDVKTHYKCDEPKLY